MGTRQKPMLTQEWVLEALADGMERTGMTLEEADHQLGWQVFSTPSILKEIDQLPRRGQVEEDSSQEWSDYFLNNGPLPDLRFSVAKPDPKEEKQKRIRGDILTLHFVVLLSGACGAFVAHKPVLGVLFVLGLAVLSWRWKK